MYDYYLGGKDNFAADREAAEKVIEILPNIRAIARENREFLIRAVTYLAEQGVRQFLDIGAGLPTQRNVHQVAQEAAPGARVVYVDNDPIVLVHARAILAENSDVIAVDADMRDPEGLLGHPAIRAHLDFSQPVAILLLGILHFVPDDEEAHKIVSTLKSALVPGGYLVISHGSVDEVSKEQEREGQEIFRRAAMPGTASRTAEEVRTFFSGLELVDPGVVPLREWRPDPAVALIPPPETPEGGVVDAVGGVGRKP